jgi:diguanylate cyclase (GGDEF)-like protein
VQRFTSDPFAQRLFAETQEGIAVFDRNGELVAWNAAARAITGWDQERAAKEDLLGRGAGMLEIREGKWVDLRRTAVGTVSGEYRVVLFADASAQVALTNARQQLTEGGLIDRVTKLSGPQLALAHLERSVALARRDMRAVGVLSIGVDIPNVGEPVTLLELYQQLGKRVIAATRTSDLAARLADDELLVILTAMANPHDASIVAVRMLLQLSKPYVLAGRERSVTISLGIASFPPDGDTSTAVLNASREAMSRVRSEGGGYRIASATPK